MKDDTISLKNGCIELFQQDGIGNKRTMASKAVFQGTRWTSRGHTRLFLLLFKHIVSASCRTF